MRVIAGICIVLAVVLQLRAAELHVGCTTVSITPDRPIALRGQFHKRISTRVGSPCQANIIALESREGDNSVGCAVIVSLDICILDGFVQNGVRARVAERLPGFDPSMLFMAATHTHTGPVIDQDAFYSYEGAMEPKEYAEFMMERVSAGIVKAWRGRRPGSATWGLGHAVVAQNRRVSYSNGSAVMYGKRDVSNFIGLEGWEDHAVDILYFCDTEGKMIATAIGVPCPAQVVEHFTEVNADYWHFVRRDIKAKHGSGVVVAGLCGPAGDQSPHLMLRKSAEERMERLRKTNRMEELSRRIVETFEDVWGVVKGEVRSDVPFAHKVEQFKVPGQKLTKEEYETAKREYAEWSQKDDAEGQTYVRKRWYRRTIERYEEQEKNLPEYLIEVHALRIGNLVLATNPFELFQDYAMRIIGRSKAEQTMLVQLASTVDPVLSGSYLPSVRATKGGGYSAVPQSNPVGPAGGDILVERTLEGVNQVWDK